MKTTIILLSAIISNSLISQQFFLKKEMHFTFERTSLLPESKKDLKPLIKKLRSKSYDTLRISYTQYESHMDFLDPKGEFLARIIAQYIDQNLDERITILLIPHENLVKDLTKDEFLHMEFSFALE